MTRKAVDLCWLQIFFHKALQFQSIISSFLMTFFNYLLVYWLDSTWEHILLRHLAGFISMQPQIKFLTKAYFHYILLNHNYSKYFMYFRVFVICYGLKENSWKAQFKIKFWFSFSQRKFSHGNSFVEKDEET